jgi:hypothetical protein
MKVEVPSWLHPRAIPDEKDPIRPVYGKPATQTASETAEVCCLDMSLILSPCASQNFPNQGLGAHARQVRPKFLSSRCLCNLVTRCTHASDRHIRTPTYMRMSLEGVIWSERTDTGMRIPTVLTLRTCLSDIVCIRRQA